MKEDTSMSEFIITDAVEEFFDDDAIKRDLDEHPLTWGLALVLVTPAIVLSLIEPGTELTGIQELDMILLLIHGTIFLTAPVASFILAHGNHLAPSLITSMGASATVISSPVFTELFPTSNGILPPIISILIIAPLILVLRNKKWQLNPGSSRTMWAGLMATSILMFAGGTLIPALNGFATTNECTAIANADICASNYLGWGALGVVAMAIGWAWPKGRHIVEELADDMLRAARRF